MTTQQSNILDPNFDFLDMPPAIDVKNSFDVSLLKINNVFSPSAPYRDISPKSEAVSMESSETVRRLQINKKMPSYFRDSLPSRKSDAAMSLVAKIPDSVDRPPAEVLDKMVLNLYKEEKEKIAKKKIRKIKKKTMKVLDKSTEEYLDLFADKGENFVKLCNQIIVDEKQQEEPENLIKNKMMEL